ncbi:WD40-repeat-containing domain protein [Collybia nuda]|uniref:WD40-repeat-containing domain protein n=1 Tax=Collybia nuda TaxID=64659 RepID=A0A9P5YHL1_9AGAR|nr:WD40-repeat-containing domain protein [Collybia nuda]
MTTSVLLESPKIQTSNIPLRSSGSSSQSYILSIAALPAYYAASASAPSNTIDIFDKSTLQGIQTLPGHEVATTSLKTVENVAGISGKSLMTSGRDGSVKIWDERSNSHSIKMTNLGGNRGLLCCDVSSDGFTIAAGTDLQGDDALILYWDPRRPAAPIRTHSSTHSDDVTVLSFLKLYAATPSATRNALLSASSDGLISISNADEDDEDEAVINVGNWGCSISQAGWFESPSGPKVWAGSDMETFSTWSDELDLYQSTDIRLPSVHNQRRLWVTDYLITCSSNLNTAPNLGVFVGSNEGDIALLSNANITAPDAPWYLHNLWTNGHVGIVRSLLFDEENRVLVTGGEDSKINVWPSLPPQDDNSMDVDLASRKRGLDRDNEHVRVSWY